MPKIKELLVATDQSARSERALRRAILIARRDGVPLTAISVVDDAMPEDIADAVARKAHDAIKRFLEVHAGDLDTRVEVAVGDPTARLVEAAEAHPDALLVVGRHRPRSLLGELRETTMQRVVRRCSNPVLVVCDPDDHDYERAVLGVDFSPAADAALDLARRLAPNATVHAVHAIHIPYMGNMAPYGGASDMVAASFLQESEAQAEKWRASHDASAGIASLDVVVEPPVAALSKACAARDAQLLVLGVHGRSGIVAAFLGSVAADMMRDPPCDMLLVRP